MSNHFFKEGFIEPDFAEFEFNSLNESHDEGHSEDDVHLSK